MSSHLPFHIFISSTHYNLIDLRAELSRYLTELGYHPMVSSEAGFPEHTPDMNPWESCLKVVEDSHLVVLILDGRYGARLPWKNFKGIIDDKISPTHGEYRLAHHLKKKMLVFVRLDLMATYQVYRQIINNNRDEGGKVNVVQVRKDMELVLPPNIELGALEFLNEVKTTQVIPWILEFKDLTDIKIEIKHQMVNQLVEAYREKDKSLDVMVTAFDQVLQELDEAQQKKVLGKIGLTKSLLEELEQSKVDALQLKDSMERLKINKLKETLPLRIRELEQTQTMLEDQYRTMITKIGTERTTILNKVSFQPPVSAMLSGLTGVGLGNNLTESSLDFLKPIANLTVGLGVGLEKGSEVATSELLKPFGVESKGASLSDLVKNSFGAVSGIGLGPNIGYLLQDIKLNTGITPLVHDLGSQVGKLTEFKNLMDTLSGPTHNSIIPWVIPPSALTVDLKQNFISYHKDMLENGYINNPSQNPVTPFTSIDWSFLIPAKVEEPTEKKI